MVVNKDSFESLKAGFPCCEVAISPLAASSMLPFQILCLSPSAGAVREKGDSASGSVK